MHKALRFFSLTLVVIALVLLSADLISTLERGGGITIHSLDHVWGAIAPHGLDRFKAWLEHSFDTVRKLNGPGERFVFVNAWNEWAEGAYLEPDAQYGHGYLEAIREALDAASARK